MSKIVFFAIVLTGYIFLYLCIEKLQLTIDLLDWKIDDLRRVIEERK